VDNQAIETVDILIIGGGLTGATLMLALSDSPYRTLLVESSSFLSMVQPHFDARSLALAPASVRILQMLQIWPLLLPHACPIDRIHVSEQYGFGRAYFENEYSDEKLGYVLELQHINHALHQRLDMEQVLTPAALIALDEVNGIATVRTATGIQNIKAKLIVAADGVHSTVRILCQITPKIKDYHQQAVVANIGLARSHRQIAYERFTANGPLAMLPMNGLRASMVWALPPEQAKSLMALSDREFLVALQTQFGYRLGRFTSVGQRMSYPLKQVTMSEQVVGSIVFVGNAAHTLHPVAGQGFNLGLRDVAMLAQCIIHKGLNALMLAEYAQSRKNDQNNITRLTDGLVRLFTSLCPGVPLARRAGLVLFELIPALKALLARHARGFSGINPDLVCGIPLKSTATCNDSLPAPASERGGQIVAPTDKGSV
jgi:2-octaprenyl-6-methoxyphenol hydroxylase